MREAEGWGSARVLHEGELVMRTAGDDSKVVRAVQLVTLLLHRVRVPSSWLMPPPPCGCTARLHFKGGQATTEVKARSAARGRASEVPTD